MFDPKNILVPTDFSEDSDRAFLTALDIAGKGGSRIFLLHVISGTVQRYVSDYCIDEGIVERVLSEGVVYSNEKLRETIARFPESRAVKVIPDLRKGQPHEEILKEASERKIDLIVIASHGKAGLRKYFIGSVAEKVMKEAKCPVLLIRNPERKEAS
ncbi:MAG: universal stress protein [Proteobacteria bacterium]|nr:universal stress protein [Pseudomonadota bacterium]MBU4371922.1 universal stress protein [Pseudomonadota bacterium]MCG2740727.1 universal stress protein [Syntrophaceae bacterium]